MQRFKNWLITVLLKKDRLVAVPISWQREYVKLAGQVVRDRDAIATLIDEYNEVLEDYFKKCSIKELKKALEKESIAIKANATKKDLIELACQEFRMTIEKS